MTVLTLSYVATCIFLAAVVRGYAGFGFSLLSITALSILLPPREVIPSIFLLEVVASLHLLITVWRDVHWHSLGWLSLGCLAGTPLGVAALARVPAAPLTAFLAVAVFAAAVVLARGYALRTMPGRAATVATGFASGVLNGSIGIAGPPVIVFFFGSPAGVAVGRASMIAYFVLTDTLGLVLQGTEGLLDRGVVLRAAVALPVMLAGVALGNRAFARIEPARFRQWVFRLLMLLAVVSGGRAAWQIASAA